MSRVKWGDTRRRPLPASGAAAECRGVVDADGGGRKEFNMEFQFEAKYKRVLHVFWTYCK